jgi:hypothetical protein
MVRSSLFMILDGRRKADQLAGSNLDQPIVTRPGNAMVDILWRRLQDLQMLPLPGQPCKARLLAIIESELAQAFR